MVITNFLDLVEAGELQGLVFINRRPDVFAVVGVLDLLELSDAADVSQSRLYVGEIWHFDRCGEWVPTLPQKPPARQRVPVISQVSVVLRPNVDG